MGIDSAEGLFGNEWIGGEWRVLGWRNFHYKSKSSPKNPFHPLPSSISQTSPEGITAYCNIYLISNDINCVITDLVLCMSHANL